MDDLKNNIIPLACIIGAMITAFSGTSIWGWFLVVAVLTYGE